MPDGSIFKRCGCRHPDTGRPLGNECPKLRRPNRSWSFEHGHWTYQLELPPTSDGRRRQLRRSGLSTRRDAAAELDHARALLALTFRDRGRRTEIADLLQTCVRSGRPLPEVDRIRQRLRGDGSLADLVTVGEYLTEWLTHLTVDDNTACGYESLVRVHLIPHLGEVPLDRLRTGHIRAMFAAIERRNQEIRAARASGDPDVRASVVGVRTTGASTRQRIRACLRKAINDALAEEVIVGSNPAALVKVPGDRPVRSCGRPNAWSGGGPPGRFPVRSWCGPTSRSSRSSTTPGCTRPTCTRCGTSWPTGVPGVARPVGCSTPRSASTGVS
ncbi:N-terminal phage integrase SAM-like domain-containing protein [Micromonospora sp. RL09-050-HVF-A]|uniref:N-terminal phage integrase SAM-like domain-containing protein n=1 Tax=Micromonospora sp. RL09-050-HVF-A TaxID=1703433 RepID=UPI0021074E02|nr:N-terminal phage integrase SAM-like domain-containing protein [Micromonospora sp. RL09-050-HVF-A]